MEAIFVFDVKPRDKHVHRLSLPPSVTWRNALWYMRTNLSGKKWFSTLKIQASAYSERLVRIHQSTWHSIQEGCNFENHKHPKTASFASTRQRWEDNIKINHEAVIL